ncbi:MAG: phosphoribosylformylglycinamidine synthase, partial [Gammaproteobacteria bacterium]|nr:phosphoribosylformylglycinamidine synthase [Gammaproteobacteria bacterium]
MVLKLRGPAALSGFRINKILATIQNIAPVIQSLRAEYIHFVKLSGDLNAAEKACLEDLLRYGPVMPETETSGTFLLVTPRPGTISPWSSKATDIAHNCGLHKVMRLERGTAWYLKTDKNVALAADVIENIKPLIHDRMT